jgi:hypothetical protein
VAILLAVASASADPLPRVEHLSQALAALRALGPAGRDRLERELYATARSACHADAATPAASCLVAAARAACRADPDRARCEAAADVIVTNLRAATWFVDEPTRARLVRGSTDYRAQLAAELHRRFAVLAAELVLSGTGATATGAASAIDSTGPARPAEPSGPHPAGLASLIDRLCTDRDREIRVCAAGDAACVPSLPWSRCAAALIWFIAGSP